jgi:acetyl esterase/lipase
LPAPRAESASLRPADKANFATSAKHSPKGSDRGAHLLAQVLFYPVTDASFDTASYHQFAAGHFPRRDAMQSPRPPCATTEQLTGLPQALVITGEADVLRDEGEAYASKLRRAAVASQFLRDALHS